MEFNELSIRLNIIKFRNKAKLSQRQLAEKAGLSRTFISDIERNSKKLPSISSLYQIANALNISVDEILYDTLSYYSMNTDDTLILDINKSLKFKTQKELNIISAFAKSLKK